MWIQWHSPLLSKVLFKTMLSTWGKFPYLEFVRAGVGDKSRNSIIKSANLIIAILLCILLRACSRYRQNRQLPMATDCWWNQWVQAPAAAFVSASALESQPGGCCWKNQDMWGPGFWWQQWRPKGFPATAVIHPLLPWHLCHSRGGKRDSPGPSPGSAALLLQQNSILPALLRCLELTCIVRVLRAYSCSRQLEVT